MKSLRIALLAGLMIGIASPAVAQSLGSDSDQFLQAVQNRDGNKAIALIQSHPTIINSRQSNGDTGLIMAIRRGESDWTGFFLDKGADPNLGGNNGDTPLIAAAKAGFDEVVPWLLQYGAKVDGTNKMGETALIIAVQQRDTRLVRALLSAGADPDRPDSAAGYSARDYASRDARSRDILKMIESTPKGAAKAAK
jgi:ankyrin repeat protein